MPLSVIKELNERKQLHQKMPKMDAKDHGSEFTNIYTAFKRMNKLYISNQIEFVLNSFDFNVLENIYKIILKQAFGVFLFGNISEREKICFFVSFGSRPHVPAKAEISMRNYFQKHDEYFDTKVSKIVKRKEYEGKTIPLHHIVWMLPRNKTFSWIKLRKCKIDRKKIIFAEVALKIRDSLDFLRQFGDVKISMAIGYNGSENKLHNCQSLSVPHFHVVVVPSKKQLNPEIIVPSQNQISMYVNSYLILIGRVKLEISEVIRLNFKSLERDLEVLVKEDPLDLFNQITFKICFKKSQKIEQVLYAISKFEKMLGLVWNFPTNKEPIAKNFFIVEKLNNRLIEFLKNSEIKKEFPGVPGFVIVLDTNKQNEVTKVKIAPAKHGPAEGQLGAMLKL